jgi:hypothetical protein
MVASPHHRGPPDLRHPHSALRRLGDCAFYLRHILGVKKTGLNAGICVSHGAAEIVPFEGIALSRVVEKWYDSFPRAEGPVKNYPARTARSLER